MAGTSERQNLPESEFDPFEKAKASNLNNETAADTRVGHDSGKPKEKTNHPFSRDFIDSVFTVVNKDLLYCKLFYFFFFGAFGSLFPLLAIYFKQLGMNASQSGVLIGFRPFIEFLSAPFWGGLADKWRRGKEMLLFSLLCWIVFTLAIAFVQPPAHKCLIYNGTHNLLEVPIGRDRRHVNFGTMNHNFMGTDTESRIFGAKIINADVKDGTDLPSKQSGSANSHDVSSNINESKHETSSRQTENLTEGNSLASHAFTRVTGVETIVLPKDLSPFYLQSRYRRSRNDRNRGKVDTSKIANVNASDIRGLVFNPHSTVVYQEDEVAQAFFILLLLVIIGEFFSAPAITFADSVTLSFLGDDTQNYGRQRMFGSLGWGLSMFFVGMALDHSTTFPDHPCGKAHISEKNYTVCFAVFSVLMSCAFLAALQFRFDHHRRDMKLSDVPEKVRDKVKKIISGHKKIDRERLVEDYSDDEEFQDKDDGDERGGQEYEDLEKNQEGANLKINPAAGSDMVTDALKAPGSRAGRGFGGVTGAIPFGSAEASYSDQPFFGKWIAVVKLLATYQYLSVLFISWFMGFGIGIIFTFLFWHLQDIGGSPTLFGVASIINHISELLAYFMAGTFIEKYGHVKILYVGLLGNIARFTYISFLTKPWWVLPFEFVQGLTHAAVWAACCAYITHAIPVELRSSAQGILQGLHHGLGRGCGAVFGGLLVYQYGSIVTFRIYGVTCFFVLFIYFAINLYLQRRGKFSHSGKVSEGMLEDSAHLAPHGVPSGMSRNWSSTTNTRLADEPQQEYGTITNEGISAVPVPGTMEKGRQVDFSDLNQENPIHHGYDADRINAFEQPRLPNLIYQNQPKNHYNP